MRTAIPGWTGLLLATFALCGCSDPAPTPPPVSHMPELAVPRLLDATCRILADDLEQSDGAGALVDASHGIVLTTASVIHDRTHVRVRIGQNEAASPAQVAFRDRVRELAWLRLEPVPSGVQAVAVATEHSFHPGEALFSVSTAAAWSCQAGRLRQVLQPPHF